MPRCLYDASFYVVTLTDGVLEDENRDVTWRRACIKAYSNMGARLRTRKLLTAIEKRSLRRVDENQYVVTLLLAMTTAADAARGLELWPDQTRRALLWPDHLDGTPVIHL